MAMKTVNLDYSRIQNSLNKQEQKTAQIKKFMETKIFILEKNLDKIKEFVAEYGDDLRIDNFYSTGNSVDNYYNDDSNMIRTATFKLNKEYKNTKLLAQRLSEKFKTNVTEVMAIFQHYQIKESIVLFTISI